MKINAKDYFISVGELATMLSQTAQAIAARAERIGIEKFDLMINGVGYFNATSAAILILATAKEAGGALDFTAPNVIAAEVSRLRDAGVAPTTGLN